VLPLSSTLLFFDTEIDHVIPERLAGTVELPLVRKALGLDAAFDLFSYENLLPSHRGCNRRKSGHVFKPSPMIQFEIERAIDKKKLVVQLIEKTEKKRKKDSVFADALILIEAGEFDQNDIKLFQAAELSIREVSESYREPERTGQPLMLTPQLEIISQDQFRAIARHPSGRIGAVPVGDHIDPSFLCANCGVTAWSGAMCIQCGMMDED
jgi:hypothetical protein